MSKESKELAAKAQGWDAKRVGNLILNNALLIIMIIAVIAIAISNPRFVTPNSLINIVSQTAAYLPVALGVAGCIVLTGTDLSAGRIVGLTACVGASLLQAVDGANKMWPNIGVLPIPVVLLIVVALGALIGAFNGFFVGKFKLHPFIVTLATQLIIYTALLVYVKMGNNGGMAISGLDKSYSNFVVGNPPLLTFGDIRIPNYVIIAVVLTALMWFIWNKTTFGKSMFALGANEEAAVCPASTYLRPPSWCSLWVAPCTPSPASSRAPAWPPTPPTPASTTSWTASRPVLSAACPSSAALVRSAAS